MESATISPHPSRSDAAVIAFTERYKAEHFLASAGASEIPHLGKCEITWLPNAQVPAGAAAVVAEKVQSNGHGNGNGNGEDDGGDSRMDDGGRREVEHDVDVADDDDDRWLA